MVSVASKTFACGDDIAVYLPDELGVPADTPVLLEVIGGMVKITPAGNARFIGPVTGAPSASEES